MEVADTVNAVNAGAEDEKPTEGARNEGDALSASFSSFLGKPIEICIVTSSHVSTLRTLHSLGIGPWRIYTCNPTNTTAQTYRGRSCTYGLIFCYAELPGGMTYEVIEPTSGESIFAEYLEANKTETTTQGLHHIAYDCNGIPMSERVAKFAARGFECVQSGLWEGGGAFAFFESPETRGVWFETIEIPTGWEWPECQGWFPERSKG